MFTHLMKVCNRFCLVRARPRLLAAAFTAASLTACQDVADAIVSPLVADTATQLTFWTTDSAPSSISVSVDGHSVGVLSAYRTGAPLCGASNTGGIVTITVTPGTHVISAREITDTGVWPASNVAVASGECKLIRFDP